MKKFISILLAAAMVLSVASTGIMALENDSVVLTQWKLQDKTEGGWLGQMAGVAWGQSIEADAMGRLLTEKEVPFWSAGNINNAFNEDDLYIEIPLMNALYEHGLDCDMIYLSDQYKNCGFNLWHANLYARDNLNKGIEYPDCGNYKFNPHSDCIDWQIVADFVGQMYPGMVNEAIEQAYRIGHIMSYGDGTYGGVFISAMHAKAYVAKSVDEIIDAGIKSVPKGSQFREILDEVMTYYEQGKTWQENWQLINDKWLDTDRCTSGYNSPLNIDAKFNAAFVLIGLLYGEGDFEQSMKISMMCGQDSDCNPSTVGGILGIFYGAYDLDSKWTSRIKRDSYKFQGTDYTYQKAIDVNLKLAEEALRNKGAVLDNKKWTIPVDDEIVPATLEQTPNGPVMDIHGFLNNNKKVTFSSFAVDKSGVKSVTWDFGDGKTGTGTTTAHTYDNYGTYIVNCTVENEKNETMNQTMKITVNNNIANLGTPFCNIVPVGGGSKDLNTIRDGNTANLFPGEQFDTYAYGTAGDINYIGYNFNEEHKINQVVFTEGVHYPDGGWFANGDLRIEGYVEGTWETLEPLPSSDKYVNSNDKLDFGAPFQTYTFNFKPVNVTKIRLIGTAGGVSKFISVSELQVNECTDNRLPGEVTLNLLGGNGNAAPDEKFSNSIGFKAEDGLVNGNKIFNDTIKFVIEDEFDNRNLKAGYIVTAEEGYYIDGFYASESDYMNDINILPTDEMENGVYTDGMLTSALLQAKALPGANLYVSFGKIPEGIEVVEDETIGNVTIEDNEITILPAADSINLVVTEAGEALELYADPGMTTTFEGPVNMREQYIKVYAKKADGTVITITLAEPAEEAEFDDVDLTDDSIWYNQYVNAVTSLGIVKGDDGNLNPDDNATRIQSVIFILRMLGIDSTKFADTEIAFADYDAEDKGNAWSVDYVKASVALGLAKGSMESDGKTYYNTDKDITRQEFFTMFARALQITDKDEEYKNQSLDEFKDKADIYDWAEDSIKYLLANEIVGGNEGMLTPQANITRAEIIKMVAVTLDSAE